MFRSVVTESGMCFTLTAVIRWRRDSLVPRTAREASLVPRELQHAKWFPSCEGGWKTKRETLLLVRSLRYARHYECEYCHL